MYDCYTKVGTKDLVSFIYVRLYHRIKDLMHTIQSLIIKRALMTTINLISL